MSIDPSVEEIFPVSGLRQRAGVHRHRQSLKRWYRQGIMSPVTGRRVKLEVIYEGNLTCTSLQAYYRFMFRLNGQAIPAHLVSKIAEEDPVVKKPPNKSAKKPMPMKPQAESKAAEKKEHRGKKC